MMAKDPQRKAEGEHILNNYRKQLAECMAREKVDRGDIFDRAAAKGKPSMASQSKAKNEKYEFMTRRMANFEMDMPDEDRLKSILKGGPSDKAESDYISMSRR